MLLIQYFEQTKMGGNKHPQGPPAPLPSDGTAAYLCTVEGNRKVVDSRFVSCLTEDLVMRRFVIGKDT